MLVTIRFENCKYSCILQNVEDQDNDNDNSAACILWMWNVIAYLREEHKQVSDKVAPLLWRRKAPSILDLDAEKCSGKYLNIKGWSKWAL
jgi:hypothetical protein